MARLRLRRGLVLRQRREAKVGLDDAEVWEELLCLVVLDRWVDDDIISGHPVDWRRHLVLVARLERVDDAQDLGAVAARRGRVRQDGPDRLGGVNDENGPDREGDALGVHVGLVLVVDPE